MTNDELVERRESRTVESGADPYNVATDNSLKHVYLTLRHYLALCKSYPKFITRQLQNRPSC